MSEARITLGTSQVLVIIAFMFSFVLAMSGAFMAAPAIATDVESGTGPRAPGASPSPGPTWCWDAGWACRS